MNGTREQINQRASLNRFQILSLDGGGIKGLFSAALLAAIEEDLHINIVDHFDLLSGTSTGGIIALGLGLGMKPREIVEFYLREGPKIFPRWLGLKRIQHWGFRKFSAAPLQIALKSCFKDKRFGDSLRPLIIPSYNLGEDDVYLFRTPHHERLKRDYKVPAWKVALSTGSAPTFFPCSREVDSVRLVDGGVWANNPTMVAIVEAYSTLNAPLESQWVLSIGTSDTVSHRRSRLNSGGIFAWALGNAAVDVIMRGQSIAADKQAGHLLGRDRVERLNPQVAADEFSLDGVEKADDLIGKAAHYSRVFLPTFERKFAAHRAVPYVPFHK
jgi:patatin-like phospholipase/acyl hydrolase